MPVVIYDLSVCYKNVTINDIEQIINIFYNEFKIVSLKARRPAIFLSITSKP